MFVGMLLAAGCINPDDVFPVRGVVESVDPVEGQRVELLRMRRNLFGPCDRPQPFQTTQVDAEGGYLFELLRANTQVFSGAGNFCFWAQTEFDSGASARVEIESVTGELELPPLREWRGRPEQSGGLIHFAPLDTLPAEENAALLVHRLELRTADGGLAWRADDLQLPEGSVVPRRVALASDPRALEEFEGELTVQARQFLSGVDLLGGEFPSLMVRARAAGALAFPQAREVPWSHRASCPQVGEPCPLTDHRLVPVELGGAGQVTVTFFAPTIPSAVVLRGFATRGQSVVVILTNGFGVDHEYPFSLPASMYANDLEVDPGLLRDGGWVFRLRPEPRFAVLPLEVAYEVYAVTVRFPEGVERMSELSVYQRAP